jgi:FemAB-related protein (PEP-CTERM system-associated)
MNMLLSAANELEILVHEGPGLVDCYPRLGAYALRHGSLSLSRHPAWLSVLERGLKHTPYLLEAVERGQTRGYLPLAYVRSLLFGKFLVSLPYLNTGGVVADDEAAAIRLIDRAVELATALEVRHLELRHEHAIGHPALVGTLSKKVHMRLPLPETAGALWDRIPAKVRNQVRKAEKCGLTTTWGGEELLGEFYDVFSRNMRDLGTPVFGRELFVNILRNFPDAAELCVVRAGRQAVASGLLLHGWGVSEVPSASSLKQYNDLCGNMLLYWELLRRSIARGQSMFDFGRSTPESGTYQFKKQWGASPQPAEWQYHVLRGSELEMRPENPKYRRLIRVWQQLPVFVSRQFGPPIVRGIP